MKKTVQKINTFVAIVMLLFNSLLLSPAALAQEMPTPPAPPEAPSHQAPTARPQPSAPSDTPKQEVKPESPKETATPRPQPSLPSASDNPQDNDKEDDHAKTTANQQPSGNSAQPSNGSTTGGIQNSGQQGDTVVKTGEANVNGSLINDTNSNIAGLNSASGSGDQTATNGGNGSNSTNNADISNTNSSDQALSNVANISNDVDISALSGKNSADQNVGNAAVLTGDANVGVTIINGGNNNVSGLAVNQYDVNGNQSGDIQLGSSPTTASCGGAGNVCQNGVLGGSAKNTGNGSNSSNEASISNDTTSVKNLSNKADVVNDVAIDVVTGQNTANENVGDTYIETGDANIGVTVLNFLNNNIIAGAVDVINIFGDYVGNIILPESSTAPSPNTTVANSGNGSNSESTASANSSMAQNINQTNAADIDNNIDVNANTGKNTAQDNTSGDSVVKSGSTNVDANVYNISNVNSADGGYIVLVNDNGQWKGTIYGANGEAAGSPGIEFTVQPDGTVVATNNGNGSNSQNNASNTSNTQSTVNQTNTAKLENNIKINADTGNNEANANVGDAKIKTGDVNVGASVMNFVNNNFVGKTFRVAIVNVLGKWTGSVLPSGQKAPAAKAATQQAAVKATSIPSSTSTPVPSPSPTTQLAANSNSGGKVLGKMTIAKKSGVQGDTAPGQITLTNGTKYYIDDTLSLPADEPIIASAVGTPVKSNTWTYLFYGLIAIPVAGFIAIRRARKF